MGVIEKVGGIEKVKAIINGAPDWAVSVNLHNGMYYELREYKSGDTFLGELRQAIEEYNADHCTDIKNHISPLTIVIDK